MKRLLRGKWLPWAALLAVQANGGSIFVFSYNSGAVQHDINSVVAFTEVGTGGHNWQIEKVIDSLSPALFQAVANQTHFTSAHEAGYDGAIQPNLLIGSYDFTDIVFTSQTHPNLGNTFQEFVTFNAASTTFTAGPSAVPEPNTRYLMLGVILVILTMWRRNSRSRVSTKP